MSSACLSAASSATVGRTVRIAARARCAVRARAAVVQVRAIAVGDKVKVTQKVVVFHIPKTKGAATDLMGWEGVVDSRADDRNGVYISANLEIKVAFLVPGGDGVKTFIAHMKEDEFEVL
eukprot:CAMPEP_0197589436 /NCGR_PEP_ID=MMETSP1326-20131121/10386_1 /TAXON_ID=1155430 /ORGANISM="Genus nov. species nov., Strain RCC2288" /LENGTH=119 /DNA_ID=CAMNT_0043154373 /DNA_START=39 /DNA_END=398 /DNA_ORIENTATION=-